MTAIIRNEAKKFRRSSLIMGGVFALLTGFFLAVYPAMREEAEVIMDAYPDFMLEMLGMEALHTIEGFSASYIYPFVWIIFGGLYFAYLSAGMVAGDIETRKMDLTLSNPVSRESVIAQKVTALWVPLLLLNVGVFGMLYGGSILLGDTFDVRVLAMAHILSVPYLLVCAGIGLVFSVVLDRVGRAQVVAIGVVFLLWLAESLSNLEPDYEWVGDFMPSRYYDPVDILVREEYSYLDASLLLAVFLGLVVISVVLFARRDI